MTEQRQLAELLAQPIAGRVLKRSDDGLTFEWVDISVVLTDDQFLNAEPGSSYPDGISIMHTVDTGWPGNDTGTLVTFKANNDYAFQQLITKQSANMYTRRWDDTPTGISDPFDGANGSAPDVNKWVAASGLIDIQSNKLRIYTSGPTNFYSKFFFNGDFDIEWYAEPTTSQNSGFTGLSNASAKLIVDNFQVTGTYGWQYINDQWYIAHSASSTSFGLSQTPLFLRLVRSGTTFDWYYKVNAGDAWTPQRTQTLAVEDLYFKTGSYSSPNGWLLDAFTYNSGTYSFDGGVSSVWSDWSILGAGGGGGTISALADIEDVPLPDANKYFKRSADNLTYEWVSGIDNLVDIDAGTFTAPIISANDAMQAGISLGMVIALSD